MALSNPVVVARNGDFVLLVSGDDDLKDINTLAQTYAPDEGYSATKPLQVWLKFLYYLEEVNPPEPWHEPVN